jgi:hypothetical protein
MAMIPGGRFAVWLRRGVYRVHAPRTPHIKASRLHLPDRSGVSPDIRLLHSGQLLRTACQLCATDFLLHPHIQLSGL